jgi:hypothetical protein
MYKVIKIHNPEILKQKISSLWDCVDMNIDFGNGVLIRSIKNIDDYKVDMFKMKLIEKGYDEKDLDELLDLHRDAVNQDHYRDDSD